MKKSDDSRHPQPPTPEQLREYQAAKKKFLEDVEFEIFPSLQDYQRFFIEKYYPAIAWSKNTCPMCGQMITERPTEAHLKSLIDKARCKRTAHRDNCYVLEQAVGRNIRCGVVEKKETFYADDEATAFLPPSGKCRRIAPEDRPQLLRSYLDEILYPESLFCSRSCKGKWQRLTDRKTDGDKRTPGSF
jgi:hypothetical protein